MLMERLSSLMTLVWLIYFSFAELSSLGPSKASACILISEEAKTENYSGDYSCAPMHEAIFRLLRGIWDNASHDNVIAFGTILIGVFTYVLYRSTNKLWEAGEKQFRLARAEFLSTHRPKIRIKHVWLMNEFWYDHPLRVKIVCVNHGTTDARLIDYGVDFLPLRKGAMFPPEHEYRWKHAISTVLKSGVSGPFPEMVQSVDQDVEIAVRKNMLDFYCIGYLHYWDGANNPRTTAFCRKLIVDQPFRGGGRFVKVGNQEDYEYDD